MKEKGEKKNRWVILLVLIILMIDQVSKFLVITFQDKLPIDMIPNVLQIMYVKNTGGAFGVAQNNTMMFALTNIVVLGIIVRFMMMQKEMMDKKTKVVLSFVLAGGIGNVIDRILHGAVIDFIKINLFSFPVFNIADMMIVIGWIAFLAFMAHYTIQVKREIKQKKEEIEQERRGLEENERN